MGGDRRPGIGEVWELRLVEFLEHAGLDLPLEEISGRHHYVIAGLAGEKLRLQRVVRIEGVVAYSDPGFPGEVIEHGRPDIVRPIIDIDEALALRRRIAGGKDKHTKRQRRCEIGSTHRHPPWPVLASPARGGGAAINDGRNVGGPSPAAIEPKADRTPTP